jgi:hypothetical protein
LCGNLIEDFGDTGSVQIIQTASQGVIVEVIGSQIRIDQQVPGLLCK